MSEERDKFKGAGLLDHSSDSSVLSLGGALIPKLICDLEEMVQIPAGCTGNGSSVFSIYGTSALTHTFQVLTKRASKDARRSSCRMPNDPGICFRGIMAEICRYRDEVFPGTESPFRWPLPHIWLGVSAGRSAVWPTLERIPVLLDTTNGYSDFSASLLNRWISRTPIRPGAINRSHGTRWRSAQR